ncbi:hypothetical protein BDN72DRAFT_895198 [Pluteus cervinus]|uniref:Uncharacterized protein n=1 Tax=Pluteus cervinus TaxID=181527 RepID=A0ACD3B1T7_9AGAR|nr:hypothetical protein BDN72DRAFT_895198 [Pluteus cervinus]
MNFHDSSKNESHGPTNFYSNNSTHNYDAHSNITHGNVYNNTYGQVPNPNAQAGQGQAGQGSTPVVSANQSGPASAQQYPIQTPTGQPQLQQQTGTPSPSTSAGGGQVLGQAPRSDVYTPKAGMVVDVTSPCATTYTPRRI